MSLSFEISELAQADLERIWNYTAINWSSVQADKYYKELIAQIETICKNPEIGRSIAYIKNQHQKVNFFSHMIIYKVVNKVIFIDRILHKRMDIESNLGENNPTLK